MKSTKNPLSLLSARERQVLEMYVSGQRQADIARSLNLARKTISTNLTRCREKFGAYTCDQLRRLARPLLLTASPETSFAAIAPQEMTR